ncbi:hypothetical protein ACFE04_015007 [Oxalis oulophora]
MATTAHAQAVKCLNKAPGRRRFVFKTFSQRIEDIDINVYRSLDKVKTQPSQGSSFFRDFLVEWRELNTAEDFISFYEEILPLVQTLPLVLLHKDLILSKLLSRLHMKARLSLEPLLRLIGVLSRDLLEDFKSSLPDIAKALASLLESGADKEPEIVEQIFTSWSCIMMNLQKYLTKDIEPLLEATLNLRYYPKDYVREFMAEATSFLLRNAPHEQLKKGVEKIMLEVAKDPVNEKIEEREVKRNDEKEEERKVKRKDAASALLCYVMKGMSGNFHSKAERVLELVLDRSIFEIVADESSQDKDIVVDVVIATFQRLCEELEAKDLSLMFKWVYRNITESMAIADLLHLSRMLFVLISIVEIKHGRMVPDYKPILELVGRLMQKFITVSENEQNHPSDIVDKVLKLMNCVLDGLSASENSPNLMLCIPDELRSSEDIPANALVITHCSSQWAPVFALRNSSLLTFIEELVQKDDIILIAFRVNILSAISNMINTFDGNSKQSSKDYLRNSRHILLLLSLCEKFQTKLQSFFDGVSEESHSKMQDFLQGAITFWLRVINDNIKEVPSSTRVEEPELAVLWGVISSYPFVIDAKNSPFLLMELIDALDQLLIVRADNIMDIPRATWQSLMGAALSSHLKWHFAGKSGPMETSKILHVAKTHRSSSQVIFAAAEYLDFVHGPSLQEGGTLKVYHPELKTEKLIDTVEIFADNLRHSDKAIRVPTLRILCHFEPISSVNTDDSQACHVDDHSSNVLQLLLCIETTPLSIEKSRGITLLISKVQMDLSAGRISKTYVPFVLNALIGIFHNRFSYLWNPTSECLAVLFKNNFEIVWENFVQYFQQYLSTFQKSLDKVDEEKTHDKPDEVKSHDELEEEMISAIPDIVERFTTFVVPSSDSTPYASVLSLLLQSLEKVSSIVESRSRQIVPLFLIFLGYDSDKPERVGSFNLHACKGKEWKGVLKEWLKLFKVLHNPKSFYRSQFLKDVLQNRLLDENDAEIQMQVLDCILLWKDDFLAPYQNHMKNLITSQNLREELTTWSLSKESHLIEENHRAFLVPLVIRLLMPKVRSLKTLVFRKHTSIHHRKAVLGFITQLDVDELPIFFTLLIKPLLISLEEVDQAPNCSSMLDFEASSLLKYFSDKTITALSWKKKFGFLHVIADIIGVFDEFHIRPFLDLLNGCVVRILANCGSSLEIAKGLESSSIDPNIDEDREVKDHALTKQTNSSMKHFKELRSLCLKVISLILSKYEDYEYGDDFWDLFFTSMKPLIDGFKQEGSSSEKPSSLFACFLAMSSSLQLAPLLNREKNLVPDVFSILAVRTASEAILRCVLSLIENLLNLDSEIDDSGSVIKQIILSNLDVLVGSLHCLFQGDKTTRRKSVRTPGEKEMRIFKLLSKYITQQLLAEKFVDILLPFFTKKVKHSGRACIEAMQVIRDIVPVLGSETASKILNAVSPLLIYVELDMRLSICELLSGLAKADPSMLTVGKLVSELNASAPMKMGDLDYDTILAAYERINVEFFHSIEEDHTTVILSHCVYDMSTDELILRHSAYRALLCFVDFSADVLEQEVTKCSEVPDPMITTVESIWTSARIHRVLNNILMKHLGNAMNKGSSVKKEWVELLREMVMRLPQVETLHSLKDLCSEDSELDFFNNIIHLQRHRRAKALSRFKKYIVAGNTSEVMMNKLFIPLLFNMLFDSKEGKGENITTLSLEALASVSSCISWKSYYALLLRCFREMTLYPDRQKVLLRLICAILDHFHYFPKDDTTNVSETQTSGTDSAEIQICLEKTLLPKIQKLLSTDSDKLSVNASVAALKLLKLLPGDTMDSQLPSIIHRVSNFLKSRAESVRNEARLALAACLKELGLAYLQFIVGVMQAALKRGFEMHVLGYSLNFILSKAIPNPMCGKLDYCLKNLLLIIEKDILGEVSEEKEVDKIASKMKETKTCKSFETAKLIAQSVTFKTHALTLVSSVTSNVRKYLTPKLKMKLESMLSHIAAGIQNNPSVDQSDLFVFVYGLVEDGIKEENAPGENLTSTEENKNKRPRNSVGRKNISKGQVVSNKSACSHLITVFALGLLNNYLKNAKLNKNDEQLLSMLDPFANLLGDCLGSKYEDVISASLKCLTQLLPLPLPSLKSQADRIKVAVLDIAQNLGNLQSPLVESSLKLLIVLLRSTKVSLSSEQLRLLIQFPLFVDIERTPSFTALSLLKAVVHRKLVVPELFDIIVRVAELMVTSQDESIRKKCSRILLQFLRDYHLAEKRLEQHLDFLLANLRYEHSSGREAILEMLHAIIMKFPKGELDKQSKKIFVQLVVCLANDLDNKVRSMAGAAIKCLVERIDKGLQKSIVEYSLSWYSGEKRQLWSGGAQVLGLLVEAMKAGFKRHTRSVLPKTRTILHSVVQNGREGNISEEANVPTWKEGYFSLVMLEKIFNQFPNLILDKDYETIWGNICELLLHPHSWLRSISSRLVALYFENAAGQKSSAKVFLMRPSRLFLIAASSCHQLKTQESVHDAAKQIAQNLVSTVYSVHSLMGNSEWTIPEKLWSTLEEHEKALFLKAFQLLESRKGAMFLSMVSGSQVIDEEEQPHDLQYLLVSSLIKKMGKICVDTEADQMKIVFQTLEKLVSQWNIIECQRYAYEMLFPLYKICERVAGKVIPDEMIVRGQEVREKIRDKLGIQEFVQIYGEVRKKVMAKRDKRKQEEKVMAVVNPERNAKRKIRISAKHRANKKRKLFAMKMGRWMR